MASARTASIDALPKARTPGRTEALGYHGISRRLAAGLAALGGGLAIPGALGSWIRTTSVDGAGLSETGSAFDGVSVESGWVLAVFAAGVLITSFAWSRRRIPVQGFVIPALLLCVFVAVRLVSLNTRTAELVRDAAARIEITAFQATFGWGAWLLLAGATATLLGAVAGVLREVDERAGVAA